MINSIADQIDKNWVRDIINLKHKQTVPAAMFRHQLLKKARQAHKKIVLPESFDLRVIQAAAKCAESGIAKCVLLGSEKNVKDILYENNLTLDGEVEILDPKNLIDRYVSPLVEARKHKGMNEDTARASLQDNMVLAAMMLKQGDADGVVAGAITTTADTVRVALQLIPRLPNSKIISSTFFMCFFDQVLLYADCAINIDPNAEKLALIAIDTADSARLFGIEPRVAMISYSTGNSGSGADVEKVKEATSIVKQLRPDIIIDGPLQYDAAIAEEVAKLKAPDSPVAGNATVFIFPDLNSGNTVYKAAQRSSNILTLGPMLQGLTKPMNDLSRGCSAEDVMFTIALSAVQATISNP
ncbi:MAG: phosphate acetyltransferase [Gammaproteobacteria bacterium]|nr:phosphate acetyltransferase [Gammaproteobacteria bacterium]